MAAASVLLSVAGGRVLGITRGLRTDDVELPGGRAEPGDASLAHTAVRELREETGVVVLQEALQPVVVHEWHTTFVVTAVQAWPARLASEPFEGYVGFWPPEAFCSSGCKYAAQNAALFQRVGLM